MTENLPEFKDDMQHKSFFASIGTHFIDLIQTLVVFGAIFSVIYLFVSQPHKVSGNSMFPTFHNGDYILTDKVSYKLGIPKKGEVIVLKNPRDESQDFIKRIIGFPGDSIRIDNGSVFINNQPLQENYLPANLKTNGGNFLRDGQTITISKDQYFVIGDNRPHSSDSRDFGPISDKKIIGRVFFRYWPPQAIGLFKHLP